MGNVFANGRSILHKGAGNTHISAPPDVCKVPTPGGPVPTPFVNLAQDSMLAKGSTTTKIEGNPLTLSSSELSISSGDEPGTVGGLISSKFKGKMTWSGSSMDVKVEGKGVVRFSDPTLHNGNTFNVNFISSGSAGTGRTDIAYGDDTECTVCGNSQENHRVYETEEVKGYVDMIFQELEKEFKKQKPLIDEYFRLMQERDRKAARLEKELDMKYAAREVSEQEEKKALVAMAELDARYVEPLSKIKGQLKSMGPVLNLHSDPPIFIKPYMVGACICKCPRNSKMLAGCSGFPTSGFKAAVARTPFRRVDGFKMNDRQRARLKTLKKPRSVWSCAAPKLLQSGRSTGHNVKSMSERYYAPVPRMYLPGPGLPKVEVQKLQQGVEVVHRRTEEKGGVEEIRAMEFGHGESVPSCEACQNNVPEMLCGNHKECA